MLIETHTNTDTHRHIHTDMHTYRHTDTDHIHTLEINSERSKSGKKDKESKLQFDSEHLSTRQKNELSLKP